MPVPKNYKQVLKHHNEQPTEIQKYFEHVPKLLSADMPYDIALAYLFSRVEMAHRRALYCGIVKIYSANSELTDAIIRKEYLTREGFKILFKAVFSEEFPDSLAEAITHAEEMRDTGMHGRETTESEMRRAIHDVYEYAKTFNGLVEGIAGFKPFGDLRGFKGRAENLDKATTRLMLKGLGFTIS
jgi:hypothetical protein